MNLDNSRSAGPLGGLRSVARPSPARTGPATAFAVSLAASLVLALGGCGVFGPGAAALDRGNDAAAADDGSGDGSDGPRMRDGGPRQNDTYRPSSLPAVSLTPPMLYELLAAEIGLQRQQLGSAYNSYYNLASQTRDARLARRATEIALNGRAFDQALTAARLWSELDPASDESGQTVETLLLATSRLKDAEPGLVRRLETARSAKKLDDVYGQLQRTLVRIQDRKGAWDLLRRVSAPDLGVTAARVARAAVAEAAGDRSAAAEESIAAHRLNPDEPDLAINAARYAQELPSDGTAQAAKILNDYLARRPDEQSVRIALGRTYLQAKQLGPARNALQAAAKREPNDPQLLFLLAQTAYQAQDLGQAEGYLKQYAALPASVRRDNAPAYVFLAQIAEDRKRNPEAIDYLKKVDGGELFLSSLTRRALLMAREGDVDGARKVLDATPPRNQQEQSVLTSAHAQVLREAQRYQEAFDVLDKALEKSVDSPDLLYDHAMAAEKINRIDVLEKSLKRLIELKPDNAHAYNALGYTLADRKQRLPEALVLIQKAIELAPDDAQIIDSLGWVYYRMGDNDKALVHLRRAYQMKPDVEVAAHLGEVLWETGARDEALKVWRDASGREPQNEVLRETLARLNISL